MMAEMRLVKTRLSGGRYEAVLMGAGTSPEVEAIYQDRVIGTVKLTQDGDRSEQFQAQFDLPAEVLSDGVQVITLRDAGSGEVLDRISLMAGDPLDQDFRSELAMMRDELELLKAAFRRHCVETDAI